MKTYYRGDIYYADLRPVVGSEQGGIRPVVILQNNVGNRYSPTVIAAPITSRRKTNLPTHVSINRQVDKLRCNSVILMEQIRTIDKSRLMDRIGVLNDYEMQQVNQALGTVLAGVRKTHTIINSRPQCRFNAGAFGAIMMVTIYNSGHRTSVL